MNGLIRLSETCVLNGETQTVIRHEKVYKLTDVQYRIMELLIKQVGQVVSAESIIRYVWGSSHTGTRENLRVMIVRLRKKIEHNYLQPEVLLTIHGSGYILMVKL